MSLAQVRALKSYRPSEEWDCCSPDGLENLIPTTSAVIWFCHLHYCCQMITVIVETISPILTTQTKPEHLVWWTILESNRAFSFTVSLLLHVLYTCFLLAILTVPQCLPLFFPSFFPLSGADVAAVAKVRGHWGFGFPEHSLLQSSVRTLPSAQPTHCSLLCKNISLQAAQGKKKSEGKYPFSLPAMMAQSWLHLKVKKNSESALCWAQIGLSCPGHISHQNQ